MALSKCGDAAVGELLKALKHQSRNVRWGSVQALGMIGAKNKQVIPALIGVFRDQDDRVGHAASEAMVHIGDDAVAALRRALKNPDKRLAQRAGWALRTIRERKEREQREKEKKAKAQPTP